MIADELVCRELVELASDYLDRTLPPEARARVDAHLVDCPHCADYLAQMRRTVRLLGSLRTDSLSAEAKASLVRLFQRSRQ